jgi:outer membrane receptor protein involved in Fe transport
MLSAFASAGISKWRGSIAGEIFRTDGFIPVDEPERGPADTPANVSRSVINPFVERVFSGQSRVFGSAEFFQEQRANGTPLQTNDTNLRNFSVGGDWEAWAAGLFKLRAYGGTQGYNQSFTAVSTDRRAESLTRLQKVPSQVLGLGSQWTGNFGKNVFIAGLDLRQVRGRSDETGFAANRATVSTSAGGREFTTGIFGGAVVPVGSRLIFSGGVRYDQWENSMGYSATRSLLNGSSSVTQFPDRSESALSPRGSALFHVNKNISLTGTIATAFRRPTLNELYRSFRVGDVLTLANENLRAERAVDGEAAAIVTGFENHLYFRGGFYCTEISRAVSNVTLSVTPTLITRQRRNLGRTRACGIETDGQVKLTNDISVSGGYLFVDSRVASFPINPALEGLRIPQVAQHQFTFQFEYSNPKVIRVAVQTRASSNQFDDDQNLFRLAGYLTADALVSRRLTRQLEVFVAAENLFDSKIEAGRTPVLTIASPRTVRVGLRLRLGKN